MYTGWLEAAYAWVCPAQVQRPSHMVDFPHTGPARAGFPPYRPESTSRGGAGAQGRATMEAGSSWRRSNTDCYSHAVKRSGRVQRSVKRAPN